MYYALPPGIFNPSNFCYMISTIQCLKNLRCIKKFIINSKDYDKIIMVILNGFNLRVMKKADFIQQVNAINDKIKLGEPETLKIKERIIRQLDIDETKFNWHFNKLKTNNTNMYIYFALLNLLKRLYSNNNTVLDMKEFINVFRLVSIDNGIQYISNGQNDASEFLVFLIDYLHEGHSTFITFNKEEPDELLEEAQIEKMALQTRIKLGFLKHFKSNIKDNFTTLIPDLHHYTLNMIKCSKCTHTSISYSMENILCLSLYQQNVKGNVISLYDTLDKHFEDEELEGYNCEKCKHNNGNHISKRLLTNPDTIIICLKRTGYNMETGTMEKNNSKIEYPMILNLTKYYPHYMNNDNDNNAGIYKLNSVVNQIGDNNYGHYFAFTYDDTLDKWINCNDERVSIIDEINVINSNNAYLLFYQQIK